MSNRGDAPSPGSAQPDRSSKQRLSKRPSTFEHPDKQAFKRFSLAKDQKRPARGSPAALHSSAKSWKKHDALPPPPGPPPSANDIPDSESPTRGPVTPVSGQKHQRRFAATAPPYHASLPAQSSPPHVHNAMARRDQHFGYPSPPLRHSSPQRMIAASYPHPPPSPPPYQTALYPLPTPSPPPQPAALNDASPGPSVLSVPGSSVAIMPFDSLPLHHQNFILKTATHCWKDQYADLQQDHERLHASLASIRRRRESLEGQVQLLEQRLRMQEGADQRGFH